MPAGLDQFAKGRGVGIHIPKQFVAHHLLDVEPRVQLTNACVSQCHKAIHRQGNKAFDQIGLAGPRPAPTLLGCGIRRAFRADFHGFTAALHCWRGRM